MCYISAKEVIIQQVQPQLELLYGGQMHAAIGQRMYNQGLLTVHVMWRRAASTRSMRRVVECHEIWHLRHRSRGMLAGVGVYRGVRAPQRFADRGTGAVGSLRVTQSSAAGSAAGAISTRAYVCVCRWRARQTTCQRLVLRVVPCCQGHAPQQA